MLRTIIHIDEAKCNGCGLCARACHEGAIELIGGKARLTREDYCDGLGDCLPACPTGAITFEQREAPAYDAVAVLAAKAAKEIRRVEPAGFCPGFEPAQDDAPLRQWPTQLKLVPPTAPYYDGADLLVAADCTAFAYAQMHRDLIAGRVVVQGCPKLDGVDYAEKLAAILSRNAVRSVTVARMEVPCCGALAQAVKRAIAASGRDIPCTVVVLSVDGRIVRHA